MPGKIHILPEGLVTKIAAGEVVERPASVVKELVENALDAGATVITVDARAGGKAAITVADDGEGMVREDALLALHRHATSKLAREDDLYAVKTLGFRGEALPAIGAVSKLRLLTKVRGAALGTEVVMEGGRIVRVTDAGCPDGTQVEVQGLFFNTPARLKFLRGAEVEVSHILEVVQRASLARPEVAFRLRHNGRDVLQTAPGDREERVAAVLGKEVGERLLPVAYNERDFQIQGFISHPDLTRPTAQGISLYVNRRPVRDRLLHRALLQAYGTMLDRGRFPVAVLELTLPPAQVDVNVHPTKAEVKFREQGRLYGAVHAALGLALKALTPPGAGPGGVGAEELGFFAGLTPIGQAAGTYLVCETPGALVLVDQHVAQERVLFEELRARLGTAALPSQQLLVPVTLDLAPADGLLLERHSSLLDQAGVRVEPLGGGTYAVKALPAMLREAAALAFLQDLLDQLRQGTMVGAAGAELAGILAGSPLERALATIACHSAVRAHEHLEPEAVRALLKALDRTPHRSHCPHGRPIFREIPFSEIDKMFKRA
ncbi:MAG: DNA mismatch repair endonuclease MutL [Deltaproteobacteria bacterium]|nr:DNA mismatch repair endonuclease MutL [Deltaproteobacteria bacterium]